MSNTITTAESIRAIETLFNNGWNVDQLHHFDGFDTWYAQRMAEVTTARERLAMKMAPAYEALGIVASTEAGKFLIAKACENDAYLEWIREDVAKYDGKRPSKGSQEAKYYEGMSYGRRNAYVDALVALCVEASEGKAKSVLCRGVINNEIEAMGKRTNEQREAAPLTNLYNKAIDY